ncbi:MAG: hypothetical protein U9Q81_06740, partial [Pseudomonadota bacterium]|nr:hypothetical protein [Pseudomonadota bacterium]
MHKRERVSEKPEFGAEGASSDSLKTVDDAQKSPYFGSWPINVPELFFGREQETEDVFHRLIANRILVLCAVSGAGKTSLVEAGLIPRMKDAGFHVSPTIRVNEQPPKDILTADSPPNRFCWSVIRSLMKDSQGKPASHEIPLKVDAVSAFTDLIDALPDEDARKPSLLIFDQFEEILTIDPEDKKTKEHFFQTLGSLLKNRRRWALFVVQEELIAGLDPYRKHIPTQLAHIFRIDLLDEKHALQAIQGPPRIFEVEFEDSAARSLTGMLASARLTASTSARDVPPLYLQVVCTAIWEARNEKSQNINAVDLDRIKGVEGALGRFYAQRVKKCADDAPTVGERALRLWIQEHLIGGPGAAFELASGGRHSRRPFYVDGTQEAVQGLPTSVIDGLVHARLLTREPRHDGWFVEIAHNGLVEPILTNNREWLTEDGLPFPYSIEDLEFWKHVDEQDKKRFLLRGGEVKRAIRWRKLEPDQLTSDDEQFISESVKARNFRRLIYGVIAVIFFGAFAFTNSLFDANRQLQREVIEREKAYKELEKAQSSLKTSKTSLENANQQLQDEVIEREKAYKELELVQSSLKTSKAGL